MGASLSGRIFSGMVLLSMLVACGCTIPDNPDARTDPGAFANRINASGEKYDRMVESDPFNATAWVIRGNGYNNNFNRYETALSSYDKALEPDPDYGYAWFSKGITLLNMQRLNESRYCFEMAARYDPGLAIRGL